MLYKPFYTDKIWKCLRIVTILIYLNLVLNIFILDFGRHSLNRCRFGNPVLILFAFRIVRVYQCNIIFFSSQFIVSYWLLHIKCTYRYNNGTRQPVVNTNGILVFALLIHIATIFCHTVNADGHHYSNNLLK